MKIKSRDINLKIFPTKNPSKLGYLDLAFMDDEALTYSFLKPPKHPEEVKNWGQYITTRVFHTRNPPKLGYSG